MYKFPNGGTITVYHIYSLEWEPGILRWLVDGHVYYETSDGKNFIFDSHLSKAVSEGKNDNTGMSTNEKMDVKTHDWYFLTLTDFGGAAVSFPEGEGRQVKISNAGNQNYSVQLIQHLPLAKGYSYKIQFDAKACSPRKIAIKLGGDADNSWAVYSPEYYPELTSELNHYSYFFTMENETDTTARLELIIGHFQLPVFTCHN